MLRILTFRFLPQALHDPLKAPPPPAIKISRELLEEKIPGVDDAFDEVDVISSQSTTRRMQNVMLLHQLFVSDRQKGTVSM
jgi:hypothetical protein